MKSNLKIILIIWLSWFPRFSNCTATNNTQPFNTDNINCRVGVDVNTKGTTRRIYATSNNSDFILQDSYLREVFAGVVLCSAPFPIDILIQSTHPGPPYFQETQIRSSLIEKQVELKLPEEQFIYKLIVNHRLKQHFTRSVSSVTRYLIFNPNMSSWNKTITTYINGTPDFIYSEFNETICAFETKQLVFPCVSSRPSASIKLQGPDLSPLPLTYDPAIGFTNLSIVNGPNRLYKCTSDSSLKTDNMEIVLDNSFGCSKRKQEEDIHRIHLRCDIEDIGSGNELMCEDIYRRSVAYGPDALFKISIAYSGNPSMGKAVLPVIRTVINENRGRDFYFKRLQKYQPDLRQVYESGVGRFESERHFVNFEYFTDLDHVIRMVPEDLRKLNKSWIARISEPKLCDSDKNEFIDTDVLFAGMPYCFECSSSSYVTQDGATWYIQLNNGFQEIWQHNIGDDLIHFAPPREEGVTLMNSTRNYSLRVSLNESAIGITCKIPLWTGENLNNLRSFRVTSTIHPEILNKSPKPISWTEHDVMKWIACKFRGMPIPNITWYRNNMELKSHQEFRIDDTEVESRLSFSIVLLEHAGIYRCLARSMVGVDDNYFSISVEKNMDKRGIDYSTIIFVSIGIFFVFLLAGGITFKRKFFGTNVLSQSEILEFKNGKTKGETDHEVDGGDYIPYDANTYEINPTDFIINSCNVLGEGAFGIVCRATVKGNEVAAKRIHPHADKVHILTLLSEIKMMIYIGKHKNIVSVVGANTSRLRRGDVTVFVEFCGLGSLHSLLKAEKPSNAVDDIQNPTEDLKITMMDLKLWIRQIVEGMEYLASKNVIHGDLAARNVLLMDRHTAKISDFGLSRKLYHYTIYQKTNNQEPLPWGWMSIEALRNMTFSEKSDVWAFGITLWEIFSFGDVPYPGITWTTNFVTMLENNMRMDKPKCADDESFYIMRHCWHGDPEIRPTFRELRERICV